MIWSQDMRLSTSFQKSFSYSSSFKRSSSRLRSIDTVFCNGVIGDQTGGVSLLGRCSCQTPRCCFTNRSEVEVCDVIIRDTDVRVAAKPPDGLQWLIRPSGSSNSFNDGCSARRLAQAVRIGCTAESNPPHAVFDVQSYGQGQLRHIEVAVHQRMADAFQVSTALIRAISCAMIVGDCSSVALSSRDQTEMPSSMLRARLSRRRDPQPSGPAG